MVAFSPAFLALAAYWRPRPVIGALAVYYTYLGATMAHVRGGWPWPWFSQHFPVLTVYRRYLRLKLHAPEELGPDTMTPSDQFVFGMHPHGVVSEFRMLMDGLTPRTFPNLGTFRAVTASVLFFIPGMREIALYTHGIDAGRDSVDKALGKGHSIFVVPGGEHEMMLTRYQEETVYLRKRKGFVRLALKHGARVVPSYVFGNVDLYKTSDFLLGFRFWVMKKFYVAVPIATGAFGLPAVPLRVPVNIVFGRPLGPFPKPPRGEEPDPALVDEVHAAYIEELVHVFDTNKAKFGVADRKLKVV